MCSILRALQCAQEAGFVHRDLKPENIFVTESGTIKVLDFGIAKVLQRLPEPQLEAPDQARTPGSFPPVIVPTISTDERSHAGKSDSAIVGTLPYMAPEQWGIGIAIDHRTDIWACGILLHQMICGRHSLEPNQLITTTALDRPMPSMAERAPPEVPRELSAVVDRCLRKPKDQRWQSAADLLAALASFLPGRRAIELHADESPYAGLSAFQERDAAKFFGRDREIAEMVTQLRDRPLMAVVGSSGVGKSSFVRAGVIPALKRSGEAWEVLILRPGRKPRRRGPAIRRRAREGTVLPRSAEPREPARCDHQPGPDGGLRARALRDRRRHAR